jgi:hypothetical protein
MSFMSNFWEVCKLVQMLLDCMIDVDRQSHRHVDDIMKLRKNPVFIKPLCTRSLQFIINLHNPGANYGWLNTLRNFCDKKSCAESTRPGLLDLSQLKSMSVAVCISLARFQQYCGTLQWKLHTLVAAGFRSEIRVHEYATCLPTLTRFSSSGRLDRPRVCLATITSVWVCLCAPLDFTRECKLCFAWLWYRRPLLQHSHASYKPLLFFCLFI